MKRWELLEKMAVMPFGSILTGTLPQEQMNSLKRKPTLVILSN
jgi:hypothetical protein